MVPFKIDFVINVGLEHCNSYLFCLNSGIFEIYKALKPF